MRERIDQLRDPDASVHSDAEMGPAPPPPFIQWAPLRRVLGMEDVASREARLRLRASQVLLHAVSLPYLAGRLCAGLSPVVCVVTFH